MISKEELLKIYETGKLKKRIEAINKIKKSKELTEIFDYLEKKMINSASKGYRSFELNKMEFLQEFPEAKGIHGDYYTLIQALGFKISSSFSSNPENESEWIRWKSEPEFNK